MYPYGLYILGETWDAEITHTQTWVVYWINRQQQTGIDGADVGRLRKRETKRHPNVGFWLRVVSLRPSNPLGYPLVN